MKQLKYDIAIVGSGVGGLASAALLNKAGYRTILMEKLSFTGGRCATLDYQGYKFDTGVVLVMDEVHGALAREVGADFELRPIDPIYYFRIKGKDYRVPSSGVMKAMISEASRDEAEAGRVLQAFRRGAVWAEPSYSMSLHDWLTQYTDNPTILGIFRSLVAPPSGLTPSQIPAGEYFRYMKETSFLRTVGFPPHGGGSFSDALVAAIKKMGGDVWTCSRALQIKIKNGMATGVIARKDGEDYEISAQAIISNAGPRQTVRLVGKEHLTSGYIKDVEMVKSVPTIRFFVSSDKPLIETSAMLSFPEARRLFLVWDITNTCPETAPRGKHLLTGFSFLTSSDPPYDFKKEVDLSLRDFRDYFPDFDKRARIIRIDTFQKDWGMIGTRAGYSLPVKTPVEGLYLVGDASGPLGWWGSIAAIKSGRLATEDIVKRYKSA